MREVDRRLGLTQRVSAVLADGRQSGKVAHDAATLLRQRVFALSAGWEDLNDAQNLRFDSIHQVAAGSDAALASASTLCRFENAQSRATAISINQILVETFIAAHDRPPAVITLDFDATDAPTHGRQEGRFFHGYYDWIEYLLAGRIRVQKIFLALRAHRNIGVFNRPTSLVQDLVTTNPNTNHYINA